MASLDERVARLMSLLADRGVRPDPAGIRELLVARRQEYAEALGIDPERATDRLTDAYLARLADTVGRDLALARASGDRYRPVANVPVGLVRRLMHDVTLTVRCALAAEDAAAASRAADAAHALAQAMANLYDLAPFRMTVSVSPVALLAVAALLDHHADRLEAGTMAVPDAEMAPQQVAAGMRRNAAAARRFAHLA